MRKRLFLLLGISLGAMHAALANDLVSQSAHMGEPGVTALSLAQAKEIAAMANRDLIAARRSVEGTQADAITAAERPNASFSVNTSSINPNKGIGNGSVWDKSVDTVLRVDQLFERGNKREIRIAAANKSIEASRADLADAARRTQNAVAAAYFDLLLAQGKVSILRENTDLYQQSLEVAETRLRAGDIAPTDVARIRVDALRADNDWRQAQADLLRTQLGLAYLTGMESVATSLCASDHWPSPQALPAPSSIEELIEQRADVKAARARIQLAEKNRELARSQRTRDVTVGMQYEHYPPDARNTYGLGVSIPLFTGNYFEGEVRRAEVDLAAAEDAYQRIKAQTYADITQARADLATTSARAQRYRGVILEEARKSADAAEFAYRNGALGVTDLLDARRTLKATLLDAESAQADYAKALAFWGNAVKGYTDHADKVAH